MQDKKWLSNEKCSYNGCPAYFRKYTHKGRKCSIYVCLHGSDTRVDSGNWTVLDGVDLEEVKAPLKVLS
jgi:hypothetical protein